MGYREVMDLPMRVFWEFSGNVDRIRAEAGILSLEIGSALKSEEGSTSYRDHLGKIAPMPIKLSGNGVMSLNSQPEEGAADTLRALANF